jgi:hypothetical protein
MKRRRIKQLRKAYWLYGAAVRSWPRWAWDLAVSMGFRG